MVVEGTQPVRLSSRDKRDIRDAAEAVEATLHQFIWRSINLFGSRTRLDAKGGDIDLCIIIASDSIARDNASESASQSAPNAQLAIEQAKRELRMALFDRLGEQKIDLVITTDLSALGAFGKIIEQEEVMLWQKTPN